MNKRLPIFVGVGALVLTVLVWMFLYSPKQKAVGAAREDLVSAKAEQTTLEAKLAQLQALKQDAQETQQKLDTIATQIPPTADKPGLIRMLKLASEKAGVKLTVQGYGTPLLAGAYSTVTIGMTVEGNFFQIEAFLNQLETLPRLMKANTLTIQSTTWPILQLTMTADTFTTDTDAGPGSTVGHQGPEPVAAPTPTSTPEAGA